MPGNKFTKIIKLGQELGIDLEGLREIAYTYTNQASLRTLTVKQRQEIERKLQRRVTQARANKRKRIEVELELVNVTSAQGEFIIDLVAEIFKSADEFRAWLKTYFSLDHERFIDHIRASSIIKALTDMRTRRYRTNAHAKYHH